MAQGLLDALLDPSLRRQTPSEGYIKNELTDFIEIAGSALRENQAREALLLNEKAVSDTLRPSLELYLADEIESILDKSPSTRRTYIQDCKRFKEFCDALDVSFRPASPEIIAHFLLQEGRAGASASRINRLCAAIAYMHSLAEHFDPTQDIIVRAMVRNLIAAANQADETDTPESTEPVETLETMQ